MSDDELINGLRRALDDAPTAPDEARIAAFRAQVEAARSAAGGADPTGSITRRTRAVRRPILLAVAAALGLVVGAGAVLLTVGDDDSEVAGDVEYDGPMVAPDGEVRADLKVTEIGIGRVIELHTGALPILPTGEFYELWFVGAGDSPTTPNRISAGTFHPSPDGRSDVELTAAVNPALYPSIEITAEPGDGNPLPTGPSVLRTEIAQNP